MVYIFFFDYRENKEFGVDPYLNITEMLVGLGVGGGLGVHWQNEKNYYEDSLENKSQKEIIKLNAHGSGKMQQVFFTYKFYLFLFAENFF